MPVVRCPTCRRQMKRSTQANARLWLLYHTIAEKLQPGGVRYSAEVWHEYFKSKFIGKTDMVLPNGKTKTVEGSTADMDVAEFNEYMERVEAWAAEHDVWLEDIAA